MVYAKVIYPPTRTGSKVVSVDDSEAKKVKGYISTVREATLWPSSRKTTWPRWPRRAR